MKKDKIIARLLAAAITGLGAYYLFVWLGAGLAEKIELRTPSVEKVEGLTGPSGSTKGPETAAEGQGKLYSEIGVPGREKGSWTQFRGADQTNIVLAGKDLFLKPLTEPARIVWRERTGEGYSGPVVNKGRVYFIDYDQTRKEDSIRCLSFRDGIEIWKYNYPVKIKRNHGMSRTVPAVTDKYLVTLGPLGQVTCLSSLTGELIWRKDLVKEYGTKIPEWYAGQCPLIDGEDLILAPAGKEVLLAAFELKTGRTKWAAQNPGGLYKMTHSSVAIMNFKNEKQYVYCASAGVVSVSAKDGKILWTDPSWKINIANVPTPVIVNNEKILFTGGYDAGSKYVRLEKDGSGYKLRELFKVKSAVFASQQATPIFYKGYFYGVLPDGQLACVDETGKQLWKSGPERKFGLGPFLITEPDGIILALNDMKGVLYEIKADPLKYEELGSMKILNGHEAWAPLVLVDGKLLAKDLTEMVCVEIK